MGISVKIYTGLIFQIVFELFSRTRLLKYFYSEMISKWRLYEELCIKHETRFEKVNMHNFDTRKYQDDDFKVYIVGRHVKGTVPIFYYCEIFCGRLLTWA